MVVSTNNRLTVKMTRVPVPLIHVK